VALYNDANEERTVSHGDRIAQLVIAPYLRPTFVETDELDDTQRGAGGFGHTGV
jgi:dUTP pyrophosphatase